MGLVLGMDEAGYGPNLGPLVVTATVWEVCGDPREADLWELLEPVVCRTAETDSHRIHVADSKQVHHAAKGLAALERSAQTLLAVADLPRESLSALRSAVTGEDGPDPQGTARGDRPARPVAGRAAGPEQQSFAWPEETNAEDGGGAEDHEPWVSGNDLPLPHAVKPDALPGIAHWQAVLEQAGVRLRAICSDVVPPWRFNRLTRAAGSKGLALSRVSLSLLGRAMLVSGEGKATDEPVLALCDKHGGRDRYGELLQEVFDRRSVERLEEGRSLSRYRTGGVEVRFQTRAEEHLPVAAASIVAKYLRELTMEQFNRFWQARLPELKATKGYPVDARRFRTEIATEQQSLGIADDDLWRER